MKIQILHVPDPVTLGLLRALNRKLNSISGKIPQMATQEQITKLGTDIDTMIAAFQKKIDDLTAQLAAPPAPVADPAIDAIDAKVTAATAALTPPA